MGGVEELMSDIDKRVVQMDFDNKKFERNVKESTESIGKLKKSLNFDGVSNSIDQVSVKIKALEVMTTTTLVNITNRITNLGIQMIKSLSVDNISAGWAKYGQKTVSVATMMAQNFKIAGKEITDASEKMSIVTAQLERLSWFSDETSYTFTDMVDNVGKFIAAGQDLDISVQAMEGIATWAALSGQNASTASRAMYQLSQAMGKGKIQLIDYKSIQNANMDTVEFRQTILDTAVALGQLTKEGDKFVTKTGKKFTQTQFAEELSEGWFTSEVLVKGLSKYSAAVDQIYELANKEGLTASEVIEKYGDELDDFGLKAFKAAQEARTFADVLSSVKDAVSSKWMTTSELIFGDKNESVSLWTDLSNALYEVFAESGNFRNEILKVWKALGGREDLFKHGGDDQGAFWNIYDAIVNLKNLIKSAWNTIFPLSEMEDESAQANDIGNKIKTLTGNLKAFTKRLQMSEATSLRLRKILEGLFSVLKGFLVISKAILYILDPVIELGKQLITTIIDKLISLFGKVNINGNKLIKLSNKLHAALENLFDSTIDFSGIFKTIIKTLKAIVSALANVFKKISEFIASTGIIEKIIGTLNNFWEAFISAAKTFGSIFKNTISKVFGSMNSLFDKTVKKMQKLSPAFDKLKRSFQGFINTIKKAPSSISNFVKSLFGSKIASNLESKILRPTTKSLKKFSKAIESINEVSSANIESKKKELSPIAELFSGIGKLLNGIGIMAQALVVTIGKMLGLIGDVLSGIGTAVLMAYNGTLKLEEWQKNLLITSVILGGILALVALIGTRVYNIFYSVIAIVKPLGVLVDSISGLIDKAALAMMGSFIKSISNAVLQFSISLMIIAGIDAKRLEPAVWTMLAISAIIAGIVAAVLVIQKKSEQLNTAIRAVTTVTKSTGKGITGWISNFSSSLSEAKKMDKIRSLAIVIQNFGTAMVKIALALYVIGQLEWGDMLKGLVVMGVVLAEMFALSKFTTSNEVDVKKAIPGTIQMIALAIMIQSFGRVLKQFGALDGAGLKNVSVAFALVSGFLLGAIGMLSLLNYIVQQQKDMNASSKVVGQLTAMSLLLFSFGITVKMLASINFEKLYQTVGAIGLFLIGFAGLSAILASSQRISKGILANIDIVQEMLAMSLVLFSFGVTAKILAGIGWNKLYQVIGAIGIFFVEFGALIAILQGASLLSKGADSAITTVKQILAMSLLLFSFGVTAKMLASVGWNKLYQVVGAIGIFFIEFAGMVVLLHLAAKISYGNEPSIQQMLAMSLLLFSFGITVKTLASIQWSTLINVTKAIGMFFVAFGTMEMLLSSAAKVSANSKSYGADMMAMALLLFSFGVTARMLASIEWGTLINIAKAIGLVMLAFGGMIAIMNLTNGNTDAKSSIAAIISMSISLIIVGKVIQGLAKFAWNQLITPILGITAVLLTFGIVSKQLTSAASDIKKASASAILLGSLSVVLISFGASMLMVAKVPWENILTSFVGITVILAALLGFEVGLSKINYVKVQSSLKLLVGMSAMLISFGASMLMVAKVPWENMLASIGAISLVLAAVLGFEVILKLFKVTSGDLLTSLLGIATSLIALSASLLIMVNVFKQFESISWESLGKGAAVLAGSLVLLGVSAAILSPVISVILLLSSALVLLGVGMSLSAMSILLVIHALQELSTMSATSIQSTTDSLNALAELIASALLSGLQSLFDGMTALLPSIFDTISVFLDEIISLLGDKIPAISSLALNLIEDTLVTIKDKSASIFDSIFGIIDNFFSELTKDSKIADITEKAVDAIVQVLNAIAKKTDELIESILNVLLSLVTSLFKNRQLLYDIVGQVLNLIMNLLIEIVKDVVKLAGAIAKVMLILIAAAIKVVIASLGGLASLFIEFISAVLLILVHTVIGMTDVIYQVFKTIIYNLIDIFNQVLMDIGPMLAVMLKTGFQSLLAGILEAIAILIKDIPVVNALYDPIHNAAEDMKNSVKNTMDEYSDILRGDNVLKAAKDATENIKYVVKESTKQINDTLTDSISDINEAVSDSSKQLSEAMDDFANGFQIDTNEGQRQSEKAGKDITDGLTNGIEENTKEVKKAGAAAGQAAVDGAREETDTHSPSRVMFKLGQYLVDGLSLGIADKKNEAVDSMTKMVSQAINATQDTIENQNGDDLTLKVGLDISGVEAKSRKITDIMSGLNNVEATTYGKNALYTAKRLKKSSSEEKTVTQDDHSSTVTYNNVFNVSSTDPERSAEEIDKALSRQAAKARLAHGAV